MKKVLISTCFLIIATIQCLAQKTDAEVTREIDSILNAQAIILEGDSAAYELGEITLMKKLTFTSVKERRYYYWLRRKVHNAYPYAILATDKYNELNEKLTQIESKRQRKKYTKKVQKYLETKFTEPLKKLTKTEGKVLMKLIYRQTGKTAYEIVKELRSGWKAFWYQSAAKWYNLTLKNPYEPYEVRQDFVIEDILRRGYVNETLDYREPYKPIDFIDLGKHWK